MTIEAAVYSRLGAVAGVTALVSTRIYPDQGPQKPTDPYITFRVVSERHEHHMTAAAGGVFARVQIDCWSRTSEDAAAVGEAVRNALQGWTGTAGSVAVKLSHLANRFSMPAGPSDGSDAAWHRATLDFLMGHTETVPTF